MLGRVECRSACGACCIAPSISSPIPGMPHGKPAGVRCVQLTADLRCAIFGKPGRPAVCGSLRPSAEMCGAGAREAFAHLSRLERATRV
ncbi:MAG TPA: YkgJ family cysteine cluster protein [Thermoanaerobaculia bacterium]